MSAQELSKLETVGEQNAEQLKENGFGSPEEIIQSNPIEIFEKCPDIVLSSAIQIVSNATELLPGQCPECRSSSIETTHQQVDMRIDNPDADIVCTKCWWEGKVDELE